MCYMELQVCSWREQQWRNYIHTFFSASLPHLTSKICLFIYVQASTRDGHHICIWGEVGSADMKLGSKVSLRTIYTMWGEPWLSCNYKIATSTSFIVGPHPSCIICHLCEECFQARSSYFTQLFHFQTKIKVGEVWEWGYQWPKISTFGKSYLREVPLYTLSYNLHSITTRHFVMNILKVKCYKGRTSCKLGNNYMYYTTQKSLLYIVYFTPIGWFFTGTTSTIIAIQLTCFGLLVKHTHNRGVFPSEARHKSSR